MESALLKGGWRFWRWPVLGAASLAIVGAAVPLLVPISSFIPQISRVASEKLGQPVRIGELRLHLFPTPRAIAKGIAVGAKGEAAVDELEIVPELLSFVSGTPTLRLVRAEGVSIGEAAFALPGGLPKPDPGSGAEAVIVRRIQLREVKLRHPAYRLPPLDAQLELDDALMPREVRLDAKDIALEIKVARQAAKVLEYTFEGRVYGGTIKGSTRVDSTKQWIVAGKAAIADVELLPLQVALGKPAQFSGRLRTDASFSARARSADRLADALALDAPFRISGGTYHGYDLSKVGALSGKLDKGGDTRFDELRGTVRVRGRHVKVAGLCAKSPSLIAGGNVDIAADQQLSGKLDVSVARTGGFVGIPVQLRGTTSDPWFTPTKGYLIGAAIGTLVLPGVGTTIGSSLGSRVEGGTSDCR